MKQFRIAPATWKWLLAAASFTVLALILYDAGYAVRPMLIEGRQGSLGVQLEDDFGSNPMPPGTHHLRILGFHQQSALRQAGAQPGDVVRFDRTLDRWRKYAVGERVSLTLYRNGLPRHVEVSALPAPIRTSEYLDFFGRGLMATVSLLFALLIGFKQAGNPAYRNLAKTFLSLTLLYFISFSHAPNGWPLYAGKLLCLTLYPMLWYWVLTFALHYQPYEPRPLRRWLDRGAAPLHLLALFTAAYSGWLALGYEAPMLWALILGCASAGMMLTLASLAEGWQQTGGQVRQRHMWLFVSFIAPAVPSTMIWIPAADWTVGELRLATMSALCGQLVMYFGLAYAVLKHRVFNFEFAVNRAMVYSVVSALLLCTVGLMEFVSKSLLKGDGAAHRSFAIDAAIALAVYLIFHQLHGRIEHWVERVFFFQWHDNEHKLRQFVRQAAHFTEVGALLAAFRTAMDRFTAHAGCAIYLRQASGNYLLASGTLDGSPALIEPNDPLVVALRADMAPMAIDQQSQVRADLMLPMSHRGALHGFVVLGAKASGESYRPDEYEVLGFAAQQIGLDIHALRVEALEDELRELERKAEHQRVELELMAGRRRNPRAGESAQPSAPAAGMPSGVAPVPATSTA